jgi:PadR family transcriptional regulator, regulatory protein AphA
MSLSHALLGMLSVRQASGYDLMKSFDTSLANVWPATQSQVYGELNRLAETGLIRVAAEGPRGRKEYALTDAGLAELRTWMTDPRPEPPRRSEGLLRVFFLDVVSPEEGLEYLNHQAEGAAARHARLEVLRDSLDWTRDDTVSTNGRLVLEYGLRLTAMYEDWARWAAEQVQQRTDASIGQPQPDGEPSAQPA